MRSEGLGERKDRGRTEAASFDSMERIEVVLEQATLTLFVFCYAEGSDCVPTFKRRFFSVRRAASTPAQEGAFLHNQFTPRTVTGWHKSEPPTQNHKSELDRKILPRRHLSTRKEAKAGKK